MAPGFVILGHLEKTIRKAGKNRYVSMAATNCGSDMCVIHWDSIIVRCHTILAWWDGKAMVLAMRGPVF